MYNPHAAAAPAGGPAPKKYVKIDGVMKLNPVYKKWKDSQGGPQVAPMKNAATALPVVTNMEDHEKLNEASVAAGGAEVPLSESTNATIEMYVFLLLLLSCVDCLLLGFFFRIIVRQDSSFPHGTLLRMFLLAASSSHLLLFPCCFFFLHVCGTGCKNPKFV